MRLKVFHGNGMASVLEQVRSELGPDVLILSAQRTGRIVEVTVGLEDEDTPPPTPTPERPEPSPPATLATLAECLDWHGIPGRIAEGLQRGPLEDALAGTLRFAVLPLGTDAPPLLVARPPGGGKTVCVARLATRLVLAGLRPTIITADGRRAGAIEQLAAFTRLLDLDLVVAQQPSVLARAIGRRTAAPVLIDAPALDATCGEDAALLREIADAAGAATTLVLPCGLDPGHAAELADAHAGCGARFLVASRVDVARRLGGIVAAAHARPLCLTDAGVRPGIADGLAPLTPGFLAERLISGPVRTREGADT